MPIQWEALKALHNRTYRRVWIGTLVSQAGDWMQIAGRAWLTYEITGSTTALGAIYFFSYIPQLLLSPVSGFLIDRFDRRRLLIGCQMLAALGALAMGVLTASSTASFANVAGISLALGFTQALLVPTTNALLPSLVPRDELTSAISLQSATNSMTRVAGPLLAAAIIPFIGVEWVFFLNGASFIGIIAIWVTTHVRRQPKLVDRPTVRTLSEGVRFVARTPSVATPIAVIAVLSAIGLIYQPLGVAFATSVLEAGRTEAGARTYGLLQAATGLGAVIGIFGLAGVGRRRPAGALLATSAGFSASLVLLGLSTRASVALAVAMVLGIFHFANANLALNLVQHQTPEAIRGRVLTIFQIAWVGLFPVTSALGGAIASRVGTQETMAGAGILCLAFCVPLLRWSRFVNNADLPAGATSVALATTTDGQS